MTREEQIEQKAKRFVVVDHLNLLKPELKPKKEDLEITEDVLKKLVEGFK